MICARAQRAVIRIDPAHPADDESSCMATDDLEARTTSVLKLDATDGTWMGRTRTAYGILSARILRQLYKTPVDGRARDKGKERIHDGMMQWRMDVI